MHLLIQLMFVLQFLTTVLPPQQTASKPISITITGTAAQLTWTASPSQGVSTYNVYRSQVSGGPYTKIASAVAALTYTDNTLVQGQAYYYVVTALGSGGLTESQNSNQCSAPPPTPVPGGATIPANFFGVSVFTSSSYPLGGGIVVGTEGKVGGITLGYIEPSCDGGTNPANACYSWSGMDTWVNRAVTNGWTLIYDFDNYPSWWCGNPSGTRCTVLPTNLAYASHLATALATRYAGKIKYYETGNEINFTQEWTGTCADLVLLHNTFYAAIKAADPSAIVGAPNLGHGYASLHNSCALSPNSNGGPNAYIFLQNFLQTHDINNHFPSVDTAGYHEGPFATPSLNSTAAGLLADYNGFRFVMSANGISTTMPLLVSEGDFGSINNSNCSAPLNVTACLTNAEQVAYIGRLLVMDASTWSDGGGQLENWYAYDINWGTLNGSNGMNPQNASAYGQMETWINGGKFSQQCSNTTGTLYVCPFLSSTSIQEEIVFNNNNGVAASYTVPAGYGHYQQMLGAVTSISGGVVSVNDTPILLTP